MRVILLMMLLAGVGVRALGAQTPAAPAVLTVRGVVTDAGRGVPLAGATVYAPAAEAGTVTGEDGAYRLELASTAGAPPDALVIRVSYLGYAPRTIRLAPGRFDASGTARLDVALAPSAVGLEGVEVVAGREASVVESTQMSAVTLTAEEVERLPAFLGEVDVIKAIQLLPGVQSGAEGTTGLYVRGGGPDGNLILLDGAPVYNASHVFGFLSIFNTDALGDVRLVKGGFPARYGGRLSSVIDVSTKDGDAERYAADGTVGLVFSSLTAEGPILRGRASFVVSARRTYIDVLARPFLRGRLAEGQRFTSYFWDGNARLSWAPTRRDRLALSTYLGRDVYGSTLETVDRARTPFRRQRNTGGADWGNATAALRWDHRASSRLSLRTTLFHSRYAFDVLTRLERLRDADPATGAPAERQSEAIEYASGIADVGGRFDVRLLPGPAHDVRAGAGVTRHVFNPGVSALRLRLGDGGVLDTTLTPNTFRFAGTEAFVYAEDDLTLTRRLGANVGLHGSLMRVRGRTYTSLQPRLALRLLVTPQASLKASFGTMQQYLHLLTNTGLNLPTDLWLAATDRVGPQRAWQAAAGGVWTPPGGFTVSLEGYYKRMQGLIEYAPGASYLSPNEDWQDKVEVGRGWSYGAEVFVRKERGRTTGWIGYTLAWTARRFGALNGGRAFPYRYDRRHDVSVVLAHALSDRVDLGATWVYGTGQAVTLAEARYADGRLLDVRYFDGSAPLPQLVHYGERGGYRMAAYHRLDVVLNVHFGGVLFWDGGESTLSVGAYNLYNRKNPFYLFTMREADGSRRYRQASLFPVLPFVAYRFHL